MSTDVMGAFEEVYKNPQRCGHEALKLFEE
jgi:hypothetical protein